MTESHLRRLSVTMRALEDALFEIETGLSAMPNRIMTTYEDEVPQIAKPAIREYIELLRNEISTVKQQYGLDAEMISNQRRIAAKLALLSIDLTEATSRYMQAYGEIPKEEQSSLDHQITKIISLVNEMTKLLH
jgi:hypothetical protein